MMNKCEYCNRELDTTFIDIGNKESPVFMRTLTCSCEQWLAIEMEYTDEMSQKYGEIE